MKQEYHYTISRTDRICLVVFVLVLLGWELIKYFIPTQPIDQKWIAETREKFPAEQRVNTYPEKKYWNANRSYTKPNSSYEFEKEELPFAIPVEIMNASVEQLRAIGISSKVAYNIKKYCQAGGVIKNEKELLKIYGMDSTQLAAAQPYLIFPVRDTSNTNKFERNIVDDRPLKSFDLNNVTALELESLPGIGMILAERIVKYRESLGGFSSVEQLKECYSLPPETYEKIKPSLTITSAPKQISINQIDLNQFTHPYLHRRFPKMIKAYKDHHGPFKNASDLRKVFPPDSMWCEKILPYLSFE